MKITQYLETQVANLPEIKKIVLIDGNDKRAQAAAMKLAQLPTLEVILLFENDADLVHLDRVKSVNVLRDQKQIDQYVDQYVQLRKGKETLAQAQKFLSSRVNIAMMMLKNREVDGVVGGLLYPTADILRGGFKIIGPKPGIKTISSTMIMHHDVQTLLFSDISVNPNPTAEQLVDIAKNSLDFATTLKLFSEPKLAFLSFSTNGSAVTEATQKVATATELFNQSSATAAVGEIQFDAAIDENVRTAKYKKPQFSGSANIYVFPDLNAGNIGYKIAQRLGNWGAIGPVLVGINAPVNDLSRGATVEDIYYTALVTALQN